MQKNIGSKLVLYPMPLIVVGTKLKPILFEFPNYTYLKTGETVGNCLKLEKGKEDENE